MKEYKRKKSVCIQNQAWVAAGDRLHKMEPLSQSSIRTSQSQTSSKRCDCGLPSLMKTSSTSVNYGRKFYGCGKFEETGRWGCRFFEWVDTEYLETRNIDSWNEWEEEMVLLRAREA